MNTRAANTLRRAKVLIQEYGWLKGEFGNIGRGFCALGATAAAAQSYPGRVDSEMFLLRACCMIRGAATTVSGFNDNQQTKLHHVLGLYDWAIALAEQEEATS